MSIYLLLLNYVTRVESIFSVLVRVQIEVQKTQTPAAVFFDARDGFLHEFAVLPLNYLN